MVSPRCQYLCRLFRSSSICYPGRNFGYESETMGAEWMEYSGCSLPISGYYGFCDEAVSRWERWRLPGLVQHQQGHLRHSVVFHVGATASLLPVLPQVGAHVDHDPENVGADFGVHDSAHCCAARFWCQSKGQSIKYWCPLKIISGSSCFDSVWFITI